MAIKPDDVTLEVDLEQDKILEQALSKEYCGDLYECDHQKIKDIYEHSRDVNIFVAGRVGSGKSTIVNAFIGPKKSATQVDSYAEEGDEISTHCTDEVKSFQTTRKFSTLDVKVWDTPGFDDGTGKDKVYLSQIKTNFQHFELCLYCIKTIGIRYLPNAENEDIVALKLLHDEYGNELWRKTVIVLTFSNLLTCLNPSKWSKLKGEDLTEAYRLKLKEWEDVTKEIMIKFVGVEKEVVENILFVPAGHYDKLHLPDRKFWFSALWFHCLAAIPSVIGKVAFIKDAEDRIVDEKNLDQEMTSPQELGHHPIVLEKMKRKYALIGLAIGTIAFPIFFITGPLGYYLGKQYGAKRYTKRES